MLLEEYCRDPSMPSSFHAISPINTIRYDPFYRKKIIEARNNPLVLQTVPVKLILPPATAPRFWVKTDRSTPNVAFFLFVDFCAPT